MGDSQESKEAVAQRHRKEKKELQAKIQSLKKSASKGDKKKRKEVLEEIAKLENDLESRQANELTPKTNINKIQSLTQYVAAISVSPVPVTNSEGTSNEYMEPLQQHRISKAQRRRDKKATDEKIKEAEIAEHELLNKDDSRNLELRSIKKLLKERKLKLHTISSDGDCLYNAIRHQLQKTGRGSSAASITDLRKATASYIRKNKNSLICYMTNKSGDLISDDEFAQYCEMLRTTPAWGGQIEIQALSNILKVPIEILQSSGPPTIQGDGLYKGPNLILTYHRHMYSLGEHYNSTKPLDPNVDDDDLDADENENDETIEKQK